MLANRFILFSIPSVQLEEVKVGLQDKPGDTGLQSLKADLEELISLSETVAAASAAAGEVQPAKPPTPPAPSVKEKWSKEKHPAYQAGYRKPSWAAQQSDEATLASNSNTSYKVNDVVLARWISGDKAFYPARITSVTGSASAPVYTVTFKSYNNTETVRGSDLKPHPSESKKRRLEESSGTLQNNNSSNNNITNNQSSSSSFYPISTTPNPLDPSSTTANTNATATPGNVISAAASINPTLASQVRKEPSKVSDGPPRPPKAPRKVKANRELEAGKSKWQDFNAKGKMAKYSKKESMFRTPTGVNARGMSPVLEFLSS